MYVYQLNGYRILRSDRYSHAGGVAIYVKLPINCRLKCKNSNESNMLKPEYIFLEIIENYCSVLFIDLINMLTWTH